MLQLNFTLYMLLIYLTANKFILDCSHNEEAFYTIEKSIFQPRSVKFPPTFQFIVTSKLTRSKQKGPVCRNKQVLLYLCMLLLQESYAPEPNPGPGIPKFPCGICDKAVKWATPGVQCDTCKLWYHQDCMGMGDNIFLTLKNVSWECLNCGIPNLSSSLFDLTHYDSSNSFDILHTLKDCDISFNHPNATSSPRPRPGPCGPTTSSSILLAQSYAPEPNPGPRPVKFPCAICHKAVKWTTPGICCDSCDAWYHTECMGMPDEVYDGLKHVSWECFECGIPNLATSLFDSSIFEMSNSFSQLNHTNTTPESEISFSFPVATSSPARPILGNDSRQRKDLPLRTVVVNCQSIKSSGKPAQLLNLITTLQADVIIGCESWLNPSIKSSEIFPDNFNCYRRDRPQGSGGGVFILVSKQYESSEPEELRITDNIDCELVWAKIKLQGSKDLYIGSFYRPPDKSNPEYLQALQSSLALIPTDKGAHLWLAGDFNLPGIDWENETITSYASNSSLCKQLLTITKDAFLDQVILQPTRITETSSHTLDLFFTSNPTLINRVEVIPGISDHEAVFLEPSLCPRRTKTQPRKVYIYKRADFQTMEKELQSSLSDFKKGEEEEDIDTLWNKFKTMLQTLMDKNIPSKLLKANRVRKPWVNRQVKSLRRKQLKLFYRQRKTGARKDIKQYRETKARLQKAERQSYWKFVENIIELGDPDSEHTPKQKRLFNFIKALRRDSSGIAPLKENGRLHDDSKEKANILNRQYQSTWTREDKSSIPTPDGTPFPAIPDIKVTREGVTKLLLELNPHKASGPDLLPARILKELAHSIAPYLTIIFQKSLDTGTLPKDWKSANVTAIFKKGEKYKPSNYRPVSLTCICCKIQEHIITSNILKHLDHHRILTDCQHGFRARRSCETQLLTLADELLSGLDKKMQHDMIVLDFSKAFDRVPHERLLRKISHYGVRGPMLEWIRAFLTDRVQQVTVEGATSQSLHVLSGVPQGTVLGPLLFLLFINDLPDCVQSRVRLFADDCVLYRCIKNQEDCKTLQKDLDSLATWEKKWGMEFHPEKCSAIRITRARNPIAASYFLKGHNLQLEASTKYLGVQIEAKMSWNKHICQTVKKANSTLGFLRRNLRISNEQTKTAAYTSMVRPILEYCSTVWNPHTKSNIKKIEMVQRRAARYVTNRYRNTSSVTDMLDHLNWESLESRRNKSQLTMLFKILHGLVDIPAEDYLIPTQHSRPTRSGHSKKLHQRAVSTDLYKYSFFPKTIRDWNALPAAAAEAPGLVQFKRELVPLDLSN